MCSLCPWLDLSFFSFPATGGKCELVALFKKDVLGGVIVRVASLFRELERAKRCDGVSFSDIAVWEASSRHH